MMTVAKLPEQRQPHKKILDLLVPNCEDLPFMSEEALKLCFEVDDFQVVSEALSDLNREGSIISRMDRSGGMEYALAKYEELSAA
jgi:hypothetical protein